MADKPKNLNGMIPKAFVGALLEAVAPIDPGAERAQRMQSRLLDRVHQSTAKPKADLITVANDTGDWIETSPGNSIKMLRTDDKTLSMLARLEPGTSFPAHSHPADEETLVLEGEAYFGDIHLVTGDYHLAPKGTEHGEVTTTTGCLLFIRTAAEVAGD